MLFPARARLHRNWQVAKAGQSWQLDHATIDPEISVVGVVWCVAAVVQVARNADISEWTKLEFLKEIGFCHMRIGDGVNSRLQLSGMLAKLCKSALQMAAAN